MKKIYLVLLLFTATILFEDFQAYGWKGRIFHFDVSGYYLYLPATIIYHDLADLSFYPYVDRTYEPSPGGTWYALYLQPATGRRVNKYPVGVAIGELPFFLMAHAYAGTTTEYKPDGYSQPYQFALYMGTLVWVLVGLYFLGRFLLPFWGDNATAITLFLIAFGTNLYAYTITDIGMAHTLLFMQFALLLYYGGRWGQTHRPRYLYYLAVVGGWIVITRPTDALVLLVPVVMNFMTGERRAATGAALRSSYGHVIASGICFIAVLAIQMAYWKLVTGHLVHYSYEGEGFFFGHPHIIDGLISYEKGWFLYTPIALLGVIGFVPFYGRFRAMTLYVLIYFIITVYVVFSWSSWSYGWSFGCRALIESLAVLSLPLAALVHYMLRRRLWLRILPALIGAFFIWLNIYQTHQYETNALPGGRVTKAYYWRVWNRMHADDEDYNLLK